MFGYSENWPCTHACTAFFRIDASLVAGLVPAPLVLDTENGFAKIEVGYVRFRDGIQKQSFRFPATEEIAWAIAVKRVHGFGYSFFAMNIAADNQPFLLYHETIAHFSVYKPPVQFQTDITKREYRVSDAAGTLCIMRHDIEGSLVLPAFPLSTEVWTETNGKLERRYFKWKGMAKVHFAPVVASTLCDHPFFKGVPVSRAEPIPYEVFTSRLVAPHASQRFTQPMAP